MRCSLNKRRSINQSYRVLVSLIAWAWAIGVATGAEDVSQRPNMLWITCEDLSPSMIGCYGNAQATTPNIDRLAQQGAIYTKAFATAPVCAPARSCLITGLYATSAGTQTCWSKYALPEWVRGFPSYLRKAGYYCTNNKKTDYNTKDESRLKQESWDQCDNKAHWRNRKPGQPFFAVFNLTCTHQSQAGIHIADQTRHDPESMIVPPYYPDTPVIRRTFAHYHDQTEIMDQQAGKLLDQLEEDGLMDNTIVFFYSDHGIGLPRGKFTAYDSGLQVPLVIYVPEKFRYQSSPAPDSKVERLVSFVDFAPTILSMAGLSVPSYMQGHVFAGKSTAKPRQYIHAAVDRISGWLTISRVVRDERYLYIRNYNPEFSWNNPETYSDRAPMRQEITRLAAEGKLNAAQMAYAGPRKAAEALFDTETDPHQIHNLARDPESQNTLARMRAELRRWMLDIRDTGFMPEDDLHKVTIEGGSPWELAKDKSKYPLDRILDCAEMVGKPERLKEQAELLDDPVPAVRLWAARGFSSAGKDAVPYLAAVRKALKDSEPAVRVAAARAIANLRDDPEAIETLAQVLLIDTSQPSGVHASRTLDLLGDKARSALPVVKEAKRIRGGDRWDRIILDDILKRFGEE